MKTSSAIDFFQNALVPLEKQMGNTDGQPLGLLSYSAYPTTQNENVRKREGAPYYF